MNVHYSKHFIRRLARLPVKIEGRFHERLDLFSKNKSHPLLNNHSVDPVYPGWWSINITGDYRALYEINGNSVTFMRIGTHSELYF